MEDLDFTRPAKSPIYDPAIAREFFSSAGKAESVAQGEAFFVEKQKGDKMYFLLEGEVSLIRGKKVIDIAREGEIIGEMAPLSQQTRTATALARTACRAIALEERQFQSAIQRMPEFALMLMNIMINRLRLTIARLSLSKALPDEDKWRECRIFDKKFLAELARELPDRPPAHAPLNKVIMREGEAGVFMYVVLEGIVAVSIQSRGVERVGPGGVFGEMALVDQAPRAASAMAQTDCSLLVITRNDFLNLVKTNPRFTVSLLRAVAERMSYMTSRDG